jgi:hypothetical protein
MLAGGGDMSNYEKAAPMLLDDLAALDLAPARAG